MSNLRKINATLDLNRKSWSIERIEAIQGDIDSLTLAVRIVSDGKGMNLTDYTPTFAVVLPGTSEYVIDDLHFDISRLSEGYFEYTFVKEAFSVPGVYDTARFILQKKDKTELSGMPRFTYYVEKDPLQGKVIAESYISDFERLEGLIADVETEIAGLHDEVTSESMRLDTEIAELDAKIDTETSKLQTEANDLQTQFDNMDLEQFAKKTGDTFAGTVNLNDTNALNLQAGILKHYIGVQAEGTVIRMYFSTAAGGWTDYLDIIVGGESVTSADGRFQLDKVTKTTTYITGTAPESYKNTKSVINSVEKLATNTITPFSVLMLKRNGKSAEFRGNVTVDGVLKIGEKEVETVTGSQAKADKALADAKADSQAKANQALVEANIYTDNSSKETVAWSGASYFLDTHIFSWDETKVKHGVLLEFSRYIPGTGVQDYGYMQYFFSKEYLVRNNNKATWISMPGATDGAKKTVRLTPGSVQGDASNGQAPSTSYALRTVSYF